ncbi:restriction endonuclease subunit S [Chryseobacterium sp. POL2]|uniref:restriction endonuclease subunit S n=1 Tax=Chryseobacterium sp. POL2 TaxID=2713414 RepID=UPI0013E0EBF6|nr:restriction endonuclease subunit S [Chryseobacterium sp. POL2]QIG88447.1 restriction endonuclease subunit S [Chryseobacterium sp. POL2]
MREGCTISSQKDWEEISLKEVTTKIGSGVTPIGGSSVYINNGTSLIRSQNIYNGYFDTGGLVYINDETAKKMSNVEIFENDVLINITGDSVARCTIVPKEILPARINQHVSILRCNKNKIESRFLKYTLISPYYQSVLLSIATGAGATRNALTKSILEDLKINLPPLETQKKIASILSAYDDLIENNLKRIKILEEMAQQTYEEWFVRMRFPGYESVKINKETGLPEGWERLYFKNILNFKTGKLDSNALDINGEFDFYTCAKEVYKTNSYCFEGEAVLLGGNNATGDFALFYADSKFDAYQRTYIVTSKINDLPLVYVYQVLRTYLPHFKIVSSGASTKFLTMRILDKTKIVVPNDEILKSFFNIAKPCFENILNLQNQNQRLREARDILLPRLMMGMIEV